MAKLLFYAHDPGGANAIKPLIEPLKQRPNEIYVFGAGPALKILPDITEFKDNTDDLITKIKPDFVITGTSSANITEKKLRKSAKINNIQSMAILDAWINYNRFTPYSCKDLSINKKYGELDYLPDYVIVMDDYAKEQMIKEGVPENVIYPLGNPHFKFIKDNFENLKTEDLRKNLLNGKEKLILWASECYIEDYGHGMELECLKDIVDIIPKNFQLIVKPHPREKENKFDEFKNIKIVRDKTSAELIKCADLVISMTSMVLIESIIARKPSLSYQKNETDKNKFILTKMNAIPFINDKITLRNRLQEPFKTSDFKIKFDATNKIIKFIEEKLCQN